MGRKQSRVLVHGSCRRNSADDYLALVKRRLYKRLVTGDIREGSYVLLKEYTVERADKTNGKGEIMLEVPELESEHVSDNLPATLHSRTFMRLAKTTERSPTHQTI